MRLFDFSSKDFSSKVAGGPVSRLINGCFDAAPILRLRFASTQGNQRYGSAAE